ncbi:toll/interleukin-1 receptor domain-containing protein [Priestia megaterium]|uniref:toll/interleukin-1 receptor domain-containing protein n=1 Tax=Priestia megaterium TaxID=1404 RepID=UPI002D7F0E68|nr:toll/interleukin-1 receptor domain-containing protein [Priestia megaterium]MEB4870175.1 toll/interleukin-1 receptor domain-containing protein [Priestia megaterium]
MSKTASQAIVDGYSDIIKTKHPDLSNSWPMLSGYNIINGQFKDYIIVVFKDTSAKGVIASSVAEFNSGNLGVEEINDKNIESVRIKLTRDYRLLPRDSVVILKANGENLDSELNKLLQKHEAVMGVVGMKIFLSHKSIDKEKVRNFKNTLELLGFDPWLDEDAMHAGMELERSIKRGFNDSCAAIFFVTPSFIDEDYLGTEVNYAISEKRKRKNNFSIITLVLEEDGRKGDVPELLEPYVWKEPKDDLEALREIVKALPLQLGQPFYK